MNKTVEVANGWTLRVNFAEAVICGEDGTDVTVSMEEQPELYRFLLEVYLNVRRKG